MAANDFSEFPQKKMLGNKTMKRPRRGGKAPGFKVKPAFPSTGVPGKTQPRDRSAGVVRVRKHPKSEGL